MQKKQIVLYLGYSALILLALYFASGLLKIGGEGLASLGYSGDSLKEGFGDDDDKDEEKKQKAKERMEKKLEDIVESQENAIKFLDSLREECDMIDGMTDYQTILDNVRDSTDIMLRRTVQQGLINSKGNLSDKKKQDEIIRYYQLSKALDMAGSGGGGGAGKSAAGGLF